jgi:hypothetical protein
LQPAQRFAVEQDLIINLLQTAIVGFVIHGVGQTVECGRLEMAFKQDGVGAAAD